MKFLPDIETRKRFMKNTLPFLFGLAWMPVVGVIFLAIFAQPMAAIIGWSVTLIFSGLLTLLCTVVLLWFFRRIVHNLHQKSQ
jgi:FtsH-binding integral membrane protein